MRRATALGLAVGAALACGQHPDGGVGERGGGAAAPPNVLLVVADDLRPDLGAYGDGTADTPHLDRLASRATLFTRAYSQAVICNPSRTSFLTGLRPPSTGIWRADGHLRDALPDARTLPQQFRAHGYRAAAAGKVFDHGDEASWDEVLATPDLDRYADPETVQRLERERARARADGLRGRALMAAVQGPLLEAADVEDVAYRDGAVAAAAAAFLRSERARERPFFLAVGFRRPHLPFAAPVRYWERHDPDAYRPPSPRAAGAPDFALNRPHEFKSYAGVDKQEGIDEATGRAIQHGYRVCVSFVDAQVGRLLDALDETGLAATTVVAVVSDHGFKLGEHGGWGKNALYEADTRVPLLLAVPGGRAGAADGIVELVDLYPSLCELAGLPVPGFVEGASFAPLLDRPGGPWKSGAVTELVRAAGETVYLGTAFRTADHRLVRWLTGDAERPVLAAVELYDHRSDPDELVNLAADPEHGATVTALLEQLEGGPPAWVGAAARER